MGKGSWLGEKANPCWLLPWKGKGVCGWASVGREAWGDSRRAHSFSRPRRHPGPKRLDGSASIL